MHFLSPSYISLYLSLILLILSTPGYAQNDDHFLDGLLDDSNVNVAPEKKKTQGGMKGDVTKTNESSLSELFFGLMISSDPMLAYGNYHVETSLKVANNPQIIDNGWYEIYPGLADVLPDINSNYYDPWGSNALTIFYFTLHEKINKYEHHEGKYVNPKILGACPRYPLVSDLVHGSYKERFGDRTHTCKNLFPDSQHKIIVFTVREHKDIEIPEIRTCGQPVSSNDKSIKIKYHMAVTISSFANQSDVLNNRSIVEIKTKFVFTDEIAAKYYESDICQQK
ncbi:MAG: hypothetical protein OXC40_00130 [Proteobacteria bacterium]|nr:hypothetical protein [Pseudomonadota bacterium]